MLAVVHGGGHVGQVLAPAVRHQQMPANEIRQTRAGLGAIMSNNRATRFKFDTSEEIADIHESEHRTAGQDSSGGR